MMLLSPLLVSMVLLGSAAGTAEEPSEEGIVAPPFDEGSTKAPLEAEAVEAEAVEAEAVEAEAVEAEGVAQATDDEPPPLEGGLEAPYSEAGLPPSRERLAKGLLTGGGIALGVAAIGIFTGIGLVVAGASDSETRTKLLLGSAVVGGIGAWVAIAGGAVLVVNRNRRARASLSWDRQRVVVGFRLAF